MDPSTVNPRQCNEIFARFRAANPQPATELRYRTPFELLVATVLSAQATDRSVNLATKALFEVANTPQKLLALGQPGLEGYVHSIGLYKTKAKHLIETCRLLLAQYGGEVPGDRAALESLPGVGRKTANVLLNVLFCEPVIAVDTHIFRVANRTGIAPGKNPLEVEKALIQAIAPEFLRHAHHWLVLHGRYVCRARKPDCPHCLILDLCEYPEKS